MGIVQDTSGALAEIVRPVVESKCPKCGRKQKRFNLCSEHKKLYLEPRCKKWEVRMKKWNRAIERNTKKQSFNPISQCVICRKRIPNTPDNKNVVKYCRFCDGRIPNI